MVEHNSNHLSWVNVEEFSNINHTTKFIKIWKNVSSHMKINMRILKRTEETFGRNTLLVDFNRTTAAFLSRKSAFAFPHL